MGEGLRILMLTGSFPPERGGVERHVYEVSRELAGMGHRIVVMTGGLQKGYSGREEMGGFEVVRFREEAGDHLPPSKRVANWGRVWEHRSRIAESDVVHVHDYQTFVRWYLPFRFLYVWKPVYVTFHGYEGYPLSRKVIRTRRAVRRLCGGCIGVGKFIEKHYGTPCDFIVTGGVRVPGSAPEPAKREGAVFLGRLAADMAIDRYLEAIAVLKKDHGTDMPLTILGVGPLEPVLAREAERLGVDVLFTGWVEDTVPYLRGAKVAFVDSYLSILEAMACGAPVFSIYKNPLKRDYLEGFPSSGDLMTIRERPGDLAREILDLLENPGKYEERARMAFRLACEMSWEKIARTYLELYEGGRIV